jgi:ribonuclease HI
MSDKIISAIFSDGGLVGRNPSREGGSWAWCGVSKDGEHIREQSGYLLTKNATCPGYTRVGSDVVTNNDVEFWAALRALENMPDGWSGVLASDSQITIQRLKDCRDGVVITAFRNEWYKRASDAFKRLGTIKFVHVGGHPTQAQMADGQRENSDGTVTRVNRHQQWADDRCTELRKSYEHRVLGWDTYVENGVPEAKRKAPAA